VSDAGLTIYSAPKLAEIGFREGKADVSELFPSQFLQQCADPGLAPPKAELREKAEVRLQSSIPLSTAVLIRHSGNDFKFFFFFFFFVCGLWVYRSTWSFAAIQHVASCKCKLDVIAAHFPSTHAGAGCVRTGRVAAK
jgi:hypothetical protein